MVVGGGAGGCGAANKFASKFGEGEVAVIDPASEHFYQPLWTLVGGGVKDLAQSRRPLDSLLPGSARWLKDSVSSFQPEQNCLQTAGGDTINYDWLVIATGLVLRFVISGCKNIIFIFARYEKIKGLPEAFDSPGVGSNYSVKYVEKTNKAIQEFQVWPVGLIVCQLIDI